MYKLLINVQRNGILLDSSKQQTKNTRQIIYICHLLCFILYSHFEMKN